MPPISRTTANALIEQIWTAGEKLREIQRILDAVEAEIAVTVDKA